MMGGGALKYNLAVSRGFEDQRRAQSRAVASLGRLCVAQSQAKPVKAVSRLS